jgi:flavodoxin
MSGTETVSAQSAQPEAAAAVHGSKPLIVYYSLTGKNKIISAELKQKLNAAIAELKTADDRTGIWGFIVSGYENIFDKDTDLQPFATDLVPHNPIVICSPIWMQKLSSPARTFLKNPALRGKDVYIFASFNGHWGEDKEAELKKNLEASGINLKGIYRMVLGKKTEEEIKKEVIAQLEKKHALHKQQPPTGTSPTAGSVPPQDRAGSCLLCAAPAAPLF